MAGHISSSKGTKERRVAGWRGRRRSGGRGSELEGEARRENGYIKENKCRYKSEAR